MIGSQKQTCCPNCGIGDCDGPPWEIIVFCPLHAAAPDLLAALTAAQEVIHGFFCGDNGPPAWEGKCAKECTQAKDAITQATSPQAP